MHVATYEATVDNGQIKLDEAVRLPEVARVYVVVPGVNEVTRIHVGSPRLAQPQRAADFTMEDTEEPHDPGLR